MVVIFRFLNTFLCAIFLSLLCNAACLAQDSDTTTQRSKDTHAIDEVTPTKAVENEAQRQIEESLDVPEEDAAALDSGKVMSTTKEKAAASGESTFIGKDDSTVNAKLAKTKKGKRPSVALALGGGGARGAAHIGVLRVLSEAGIKIDYIVGNSMGAIVGGLYAAGVPLDRIEAMILDGSLRKAYKPGMVPPAILLNPFEKLLHPFRKHYAGLWSGKKFGKFLEKQLPENVQNIEDTPIPFSAVATNLLDGKAYRISDGKLSTAMRASSSIPGILQPVAIGDKVYVDGAVRANMPASGARDTGADIVVAVLVDNPLKILPAIEFRSLSGILGRMTDVMLAVADARQLPFADIIINPDVSGIGVVNGTREDAKRAILAGETATRKALPEIKKRLLRH
ncbi:patatin-like phospholipase family protein [bacterium]|nr:patatin-like phospholipase family protein [bacterium]